MAFSNDSNPARSIGGLLRETGAIALFLDFDGVLAEIAPTPDAVQVPPSTIARLQTLGSALDGALAIVTGRALEDIDGLVSPLVLPVAADHGNHRRTRQGSVTVLNEDAEREIPELATELRSALGDDDRIIVEQKPAAVAVHYRRAPELAERCHEIVEQAVTSCPNLSLISGKMVIEARAAGVDKGAAVRGFMQEEPFSGRTPLFIGDDVTDEDGFAAVQELGGIGIKVGPGETAAHYRIGGTSDVPALLDALIRSQGAIR